MFHEEKERERERVEIRLPHLRLEVNSREAMGLEHDAAELACAVVELDRKLCV